MCEYCEDKGKIEMGNNGPIVDCPVCESPRSPAGSIATSELARNIRRNIKFIHRELRPGDDRDSSLIDIVNHIDALAQQIEYGN